MSNHDAMLKAVRGALIDADHLAECSERLLAALNRKAGAQERVAATDTACIEAQECADIELNSANELVSEYWMGVRSAAYEYRKRAERARKEIAEVVK